MPVTSYKLQTAKPYSGPMPSVEGFMTHVEDLHAMGFRGQDVIVSVADSGVDLNDPKTKAAVIGGRNFVPGEDPNLLQDAIGHGGLVTKIILTIAPEAKIYAARVFGSTGTADNAEVAAGLMAAAQAGDLTNASLGGDQDPAITAAVREHERLQKPLLAAAGNGGDGRAETVERSWPAADPYAIAIGAVDRGALADTSWDFIPLRPANYSSSFPGVDGVAVGRIPGAWEQGTSFASPVVAGLVACYISLCRATGRPYDDDSVYQWLTNNARQLSGLPARNDQTGYGLFNLRPYRTPTLLEVNPSTLDTKVNGQASPWKVAPINKNGRLYFYGTEFATKLGARGEWNSERRVAEYRS